MERIESNVHSLDVQSPLGHMILMSDGPAEERRLSAPQQTERKERKEKFMIIHWADVSLFNTSTTPTNTYHLHKWKCFSSQF